MALYSVLAEERATEINDFPRKKQNPETESLVFGQAPQSESEKAVSVRLLEVEDNTPLAGAPLTYRSTCRAAWKYFIVAQSKN